MTAITTTTRAERASRRRPVPWTRLAWVTYRQHRTSLEQIVLASMRESEGGVAA